MPNVGSVLREEITRLSRRETRKQMEPTKKATNQHRHHIAALNKKVAQLERQVGLLTRQGVRQQQASTAASGNGSPSTKTRFVAKGLRSHRSRLGLSAGTFGRLVGVSANSVYAWEHGRTTPRKEQLAKIAALRGIGKRDIAKRLEVMRPKRSGPRRAR
jgi:DNA-binding transcriptional regulator YiaG